MRPDHDNIRYAIRFGNAVTAPLIGTFRSVEKARWYAEQECDGQRYTIHRIAIPSIEVGNG